MILDLVKKNIIDQMLGIKNNTQLHAVTHSNKNKVLL